MIWFALAPFICGAVVLAAWLLAAFAAGARADEAGENARRQLGERPRIREVAFTPTGQVFADRPVEPEHSHRSALAGRRPERLGVFAQVGRPGHPPLNSNDR